MILDDNAQYALVRPNILFSIDGGLVEWPGITGESRKQKLRTLFKVESPLYKNRKVKVGVDWHGKYSFGFVWRDDLFLITLDEYKLLCEAWAKEDRIIVLKQDLAELEDEYTKQMLIANSTKSKVTQYLDLIDSLKDEIKNIKSKVAVDDGDNEGIEKEDIENEQ